MEPIETMAVSAVKRSCRTCRYWTGPYSAGFRQCEWPHPELPFWASISDGPDHADWTAAEQGSRCQVWEERAAEKTTVGDLP